MDNKKDKLFCGVRKEKILLAKPVLNEEVIHEWFFHQKERTSIHYKKEILIEPSPWTEDEILSKYKFVNTKRKWDRESRWLIKNLTDNDDLSYEDKILNCFLFRVINKSETMDLLKGPFRFLEIDLDYINKDLRKILEEREKENPDYVFFSAAYILGGPKVNFGKFIHLIEGEVEPNMILRMIKFVYYNKDKIINGVVNSKDQKEVYDHLRTFNGIGKFLSYQIFVDLTYIEDFPFTEHNFVVSGPGCERGIDWIFKNRDGMTSEECLFWFTLNQYKIAEKYNIGWDTDKIFHFLPKEERFYTLMDMENSGACEIDKRCRTLFSGKRPKQKYNI